MDFIKYIIFLRKTVRSNFVIRNIMITLFIFSIFYFSMTLVTAETSYSPMGVTESMENSYYNDLYVNSFDNTDARIPLHFTHPNFPFLQSAEISVT